MKGSEIPKVVFIIPFFILFSLGSLFWAAGWGIKLEAETLFVELKIPTPTQAPVKNPPVISARSVLVIDKSSGGILFSKNPNLRFSPASATKIMTALVALNYYKPESVLTVNEIKTPLSNMGLISGERITFLNILYGLLLNSGNDAAFALAENYPGGREAFISKMNKKAQEIGLSNTYFADPAGLSDDENFTTTLDLANLALKALKNPIFARIVATREKTVFDEIGQISHRLENLNKLLWEVPGVNGVKTGFTERAGGVLVTSFEEENKHLLIIVFKSEDRFQDTKNIIEWVSLQTRKRK